MGTKGRNPLGWTQPVLPALPPGEAQREAPFEVWGRAAEFPPQAAPGFGAAWRMGILPAPVPPRPPAPVPGLSSWDRVRIALAVAGAAFLVGLPTARAAGAGLVGFVGLAAPLLAAGWLLRSTRARDLVERAAGYTSMPMFTGLWRLDRRGRVLRAPAAGVPPPGFYPSPYFPGLLQRWDGPGWAPLPEQWWRRRREEDYFRRPDVPFL